MRRDRVPMRSVEVVDAVGKCKAESTRTMALVVMISKAARFGYEFFERLYVRHVVRIIEHILLLQYFCRNLSTGAV